MEEWKGTGICQWDLGKDLFSDLTISTALGESISIYRKQRG